MIKPGRYRHFKGKEYEVIGTAKHSETLEEMVVYRQLYGEHGLWVRPASMWEETVERDGKPTSASPISKNPKAPKTDFRRQNKMNKKLIMLVLTIILCFVLAVLMMDCRLSVVHYNVENTKGEGSMRIAYISDLHSCSYGGKDMSDLIEAVRAQNPDVVLFGGGIFDSRRMPDDNAITLLAALGKEFECYYTTGNHEMRHENPDYYKEIVASCGVTVLDETHTKMAISAVSSTPDIYGFDDTTAYGEIYDQVGYIKAVTENYHFEKSFNVLLIHNPQYFEEYAELGFDLVLCGHAHGGQFRIPGILNGLYAPGQGFFPKYAGGEYTLDSTKMIVSRGLAKESTPLPRIFNRPELVIVDIE